MCRKAPVILAFIEASTVQKTAVERNKSALSMIGNQRGRYLNGKCEIYRKREYIVLRTGAFIFLY